MKEENTENKRKKFRQQKDEYEDPEEKTMGDVYDVAEQVIKVHSQISTINTDFIIANLNPKLLENPVIQYIRNQLTTIEIINNQLNNIELEDEYYKKKIEALLLNKVYSLVDLSRADNGLVLKALLDYIRANAGTEKPLEPLEEKEEKIGGKLNPMNWGKKEWKR